MMGKLPQTMRAVLLTGHGGFERLEYRQDVRRPSPAPGEVLIKVAAAAVNNTDINTRIGWYSKAASCGTGDIAASGAASAASDAGWSGTGIVFPRIQGIDACGVIVAVGEGVDSDRLGERVIVDPTLRSSSTGPYDVTYLGSERDGAFADFVTVPAVNAWSIDSAFSDAELASFPCACSTAENMLVRAGVSEGESVVVTGASGGVGSAAVQLAKRRNAKVVAIAGLQKAAALISLGASRVVGREADLVAELGRQSIDVVLDVVGGSRFAPLLEILKRGGRYAVAGAIDAPVVQLDLRTVYLKDLRLLGCTVAEPGIFRSLVSYIEHGELRPVVSATYPMSEIIAAQKDFLGKSRPGKIVLKN